MIPHNPNPMNLLSHADRLAKEHAGGKLNLVFSGITAVSLGVMTIKMVVDMLRDGRDRDHDHHHRHGHGLGEHHHHR